MPLRKIEGWAVVWDYRGSPASRPMDWKVRKGKAHVSLSE